MNERKHIVQPTQNTKETLSHTTKKKVLGSALRANLRRRKQASSLEGNVQVDS
jgi:hypothetical protein